MDEVLAVGDIRFKKCFGKMGDVARGGRTIMLVSHQLNQIRRLCQRTVRLDGGVVPRVGPTAELVSAYEDAMTSGGVDEVRAGAWRFAPMTRRLCYSKSVRFANSACPSAPSKHAVIRGYAA